MKRQQRFRAFCAAVLAAGLVPILSAVADPLFKTAPARQETIDQYRWTKRPIVVFAPSQKDKMYTEQIQRLGSDRAGLAERDVVVLSDIGGKGNGGLRDTLTVDGFEIVLIGKDGGVKLRSKTPVTLERLFARIDSMPMRQREMQDRRGAN